MTVTGFTFGDGSTNTTQTTWTATCPTVSAGDALVVLASTNGSAPILSVSGGGTGVTWTSLSPSNPDVTGTNIVSNIWTAAATGTSTGSTITITSNTSGRLEGAGAAVTGFTPTSAVVALTQQTTASTSIPFPSVTVTAAGSQLLGLAVLRVASTTTASLTAPSGSTNVAEANSAYTSSAEFTDAIVAVNSTVGTGSHSPGTGTASTSVADCAIYTVALAPSTVAASASGAITLGGAATGTAVAAASGAITLGGAATANATSAAGTISLGGTATGTARASATGGISLDGLATVVPPPPPPAPPPQHPPLVPLPDQGAQGLLVAVYDRGYTLQGYVNRYTSCAVTFQHMDNGAGTLVLPETDPLVPQLLKGYVEVVPVTVTDRFGRRWSGRVDKDAVDKGDGQSHAVPGSGVVTVTLVDEWPMLSRMLASPFGASTAMAYGVGAAEFDVRSGALHTVAKGYITDAAKRIWGSDGSGNPLGPVAVVPPPVSDGSPTVTLQAKWTKLTDLLADPLRSNALTLIVYLWLPGDPQPLGLSLTAPRYVVDIVDVNDNPQIVWDDPAFLQRKVALTAPAAFRAVIGGQGSGTAQTFATYTDTDLQTSLGGYGYPETYFSSSSTSTSASIQQDAATQLLATEGGLAVQATVQDGVPWTFGADYTVGDIVGVRALGLDIRQRVVSVQMVDDRDSGYRLLPAVGDDVATLTIQQRTFQTLRALDARIRQLETGF